MFNPGEMNCRITIKKRTDTRDTEGNIVPAYSDRATVWAKIQAITARIRDSYQEQNHEILTRITIRYNSAVLQTDRIYSGTRVFEQIGPSINVDEKRAYMWLECREIVESG